jgi:aspartate aminotransferase
MSISKELEASIQGSSLIRKMFEEGNRRRALYGDENVFDFSIGNPVFEPPPVVKEALITLLNSDETGTHRYMPNPGFPSTRSFIAEKLKRDTGLPFSPEDIIMTTGAGGALNVAMKTLLDPGEEVIVILPYFFEYNAYVTNHCGRIKQVASGEGFRLDLTALASSLTKNVKAVLINSPNNPTGVVYTESELAALGALLQRKTDEFGDPIWLISDEPYRNIAYDTTVPSVFTSYDHSVVATSYSKDLAIPGERIGYLAFSPRHQDRELARTGAALALRTLGFVNAPALMQRMLPMVGDARVDLMPYHRNRDLLYDHLIACGFSCVKPEGAFYIFPRCPIDDDMSFVAAAQQLNLMLVPGTGFGAPGYCRISYCFETEMIERSLPLFTQLARQYRMIE